MEVTDGGMEYVIFRFSFYSVMKRLSVFVLFYLLVASSCQSQNQNTAGRLNADAFEKAIAEPKAQILDVRTPGEFERGHIEGAMLANWNDRAEFERRTAALSKETPIYIYCLSGPRSDAAGNWLEKKGFRVVHLTGGFAAWQRAGKASAVTQQSAPISWIELKGQFPEGKPVLLEIGADWCPPCRQMKPIVEKLDKESAGKYKIIKIDVSEQPELANQLKAESYPTFILYKNGEEMWRQAGIVSESELRSKLN